MREYIDREVLLKSIEEHNTLDEWLVSQYNADWIYSFIETAPAADVEEVRHGEWNRINQETTGLPWKCRCSECGCPQDFEHNFCPNCGATMKG